MGFDYIVIMMLIILSILLNATVFFVLAYHFNKLKSRDFIVLSLAIADLIKATVGYPYLLTDYGRSSNTAATPQCTLSAFIITTASITTIAHLVMLSVTIYISLSFPYLMIRLQKKVLCFVVFVLPCWLYGLLWGLLPLLGWSSYDKETEQGYRCAMNFREHTLNVNSYNITLFVCGFVIPLLLACFFYIRVANIFRSMRRNAVVTNGLGSSMIRETRRQEYSIFVMSLIMLAAFILAWFPYASFVLMTAFKYTPTQMMFDVAAILAKTSSFYNPLIYGVVYKEFRKKANEIFRRRSRNSRREKTQVDTMVKFG